MTRRFFDRTRIGCGRYAYTLTELLVVVTIVIILVAATLPIAKRVMDDSRTRDSGRLLAGNFAMARTYAARNNRPFGLWFELVQPIGAPATVRQCTQVYLAEIQAPYAGDVLMTSTACVTIPLVPATPPNAPDLRGPWALSVNGASMLPTLVEPGEPFSIRFSQKGPWYLGYRDTSNPPNYFVLGLTGADGEWGQAGVDDDGNSNMDDQSEYMAAGSDDLSLVIPPHGNSLPPPAAAFRPFQLLRMPRRVGNPIETIAGTCIDFEFSGMGPGGFGAVADGGLKGTIGSRLVVMFAPGGQVETLLLDNTAYPTQGTLHFLIGQLDKMNNPLGADPDLTSNLTGLLMFNRAQSNLADVNSVWVSVGRLNGQITTTENLIPPHDLTSPTTTLTTLTLFPGEAVPPAGRQVIIDPSRQTGLNSRATYMTYCREPAIGREQMGGK